MLPFVYCWWQPSYTTIRICRGSFTFYKLSLPIYPPSMDFLIRQKHLLCQNFIHKLSWLREFYKLNQIAKMSKGEKINALQFRQRSPTVVTSVVTQLWVLPPWRHTCWVTAVKGPLSALCVNIPANSWETSKSTCWFIQAKDLSTVPNVTKPSRHLWSSSSTF